MDKEQGIARLDVRMGSVYSFALIALVAASSWAVKGDVHAAQQAQMGAWPDPLVLQSGAAVHTRAEFERLRRGEILHLFEENVYGRTPTTTLPMHVVSTRVDEGALHGRARRKQITIAVGPHRE